MATAVTPAFTSLARLQTLRKLHTLAMPAPEAIHAGTPGGKAKDFTHDGKAKDLAHDGKEKDLSAANDVLNVFELAEPIMLLLPPTDVLFVANVNRTCHSVMTTSAILRSRVWKMPVRGIPGDQFPFDEYPGDHYFSGNQQNCLIRFVFEDRHIFVRRIGDGEVIAALKLNYSSFDDSDELYLDPPIVMNANQSRVWFEWESTGKYEGYFKVSVWDAKEKSLWSEDLAHNPSHKNQAYNYLKMYHRDPMFPLASKQAGAVHVR